MPEDRDPPPLGTRASRGRDLARLSASAGAGYLAARVRGLRNGDAEAEFHEETARRVLALLGEMKGAAMKLGQIASFVDLDVPDEVRETYQDALAALRAQAPPIDVDVIERVLLEQYGAPPEEVFARWDREPIASASIGQVHRARLPDGAEVAVKVQYPGVAEAIESDLGNAEVLAPLAKVVAPSVKIRPLMEELRERLADELDYQREAAYHEAFALRYEGHPFIRVPRVHAEWCRPLVLVTDYAEGASFEEMLATSTDAERQRYAEILYRFVFGSLHRFRLFNADPHPGNYLFPGDGSVVFLDFGSVKTFSTATRTGMIAQIRAMWEGDAAKLEEVMAEAGFLPQRHPDPERVLAWFSTFNRPILKDEEFTYTAEFAREVVRATSDPRGGWNDMLRRLNLPPDYLVLNRIQWGVNSIMARLGARGTWHRILRDMWEELPPQTPLGEAEREFMQTSPYRA